MKLVHLDDIAWEDWSSPGGKFHGSGRQVSLALSAVPDAHLNNGGHPFDLEHGRLRPGKAGCPFHSHSSQWELFVITRGEGTVRHGDARTVVRAGDAVMHPPGPEAHQLINTGAGDLEYFLFADNPAVDVWHYPDSAKWGYRPHGGIFRKVPTDYNDGEEDGAPTSAPPRVAPPPTEAQRTRFVTIDAIAETGRLSPGGKFGSYRRDISLALGGIADTGTWGGGHPFDLQQRRVPAGRAVCPRHAHTVMWELFIALAGTATVRSGDETHAVRAGHVWLQPPGTPHQIRNAGDDDFVFHVLADNPRADSCYYPDSDKWMLDPQARIFRMQDTTYYDGEE
jgi:uncharacterized cupin superfamily protein